MMGICSNSSESMILKTNGWMIMWFKEWLNKVSEWTKPDLIML